LNDALCLARLACPIDGGPKNQKDKPKAKRILPFSIDCFLNASITAGLSALAPAGGLLTDWGA
jgi:hypothetical protein